MASDDRMNWQEKAEAWSHQDKVGLYCARGEDRPHTSMCMAYADAYLAGVRAGLEVALTECDKVHPNCCLAAIRALLPEQP